MKHKGSKQQNIKQRNRALVLRSILNGGACTRASIARDLGLTKTTLTNIVGELMRDGIVSESPILQSGEADKAGRKSIELLLAPDSPVVLAFLIQRGNLHAVLSDLSGKLLTDADYRYTGLISPEDLQEALRKLYRRAIRRNKRRIIACGIACIGPLDTQKGVMLSPYNFFTESCDFAIVSFLSGLTGLPAYLCNDATAGAVAEKLFGNGREEENFIYISVYRGIGAGLFLNNNIYNGAFGQDGELGHMSIDYDGPKCVCGNHGCLEVYADIARILRSKQTLRAKNPNHPLFKDPETPLPRIIALAESGDSVAQDVVSEYCGYLACAVSNLISLLNVNVVILSASGKTEKGLFETTLERMINEHSFLSHYETVRVVPAALGPKSPLYGSAGNVLWKLFSGDIYPV